MQYAQTIVYVENVESTLVFYKKAFDLNVVFQSPCGNYDVLETEQNQDKNSGHVAFCKASFVKDALGFDFQQSDSAQKPFGCELCFATGNVKQAFKKATAAGATCVSEPKAASWGGLLAYVRDCNGFLVALAEPHK